MMHSPTYTYVPVGWLSQNQLLAFFQILIDLEGAYTVSGHEEVFSLATESEATKKKKKTKTKQTDIHTDEP